MVKKTVRYKDPLTKEEVVEELYFHLTAAELMEMQIDKTTVAGEMIGRIAERVEQAEAENIKVEDLEEFPDTEIPKLFQLVKTFVINGYQVRGDNGRFTKNKELREQFAASEAYSALILELGSDAVKGAEFINGMVPSDLSEQVAKVTGGQAPAGPRPLAVVDSPREVTRKEFAEMSTDDLAKLNLDLSQGRAVLVEDPTIA